MDYVTDYTYGWLHILWFNNIPAYLARSKVKPEEHEWSWMSVSKQIHLHFKEHSYRVDKNHDLKKYIEN